jgi:hypothetical protein
LIGGRRATTLWWAKIDISQQQEVYALMATKAGVGMSQHHNPNIAGRQAAEQALTNAGISAKPDFVFMFASIGYDQRSLLRAVRQTTGEAPLSGCSAEGTINGDNADESNFSVVVTVISSDELEWRNGLESGLEADPRAVGKRVAQELLPELSPASVGLFVFPDAITGNLDQFFAGLEEKLPSDRFLPLWGGGAANNFNFREPTYQYCDDEIISDGVSYALLSGKARAGWAISHGLVPIGGERKVTRCEGNVVYEIDGKPAIEVLKEYLPENALANDEDLMRYGASLALSFRDPSYMQDEEYVVRAINLKQRTDGAITVQTEVQEGTSIWFSSRDKEKIAAGLDRMAKQINQQLNGAQPKLVLQFECLTRGKMMFREQEKLKLLKRLRESIGPDTPWAGFYALGEIGPVGEHNNRHEFTAVVLALS